MEQARERGIDPFPVKYERTHTNAAAIAEFEAQEATPELIPGGKEYRLAGRIRAWRDMGKSQFVDIYDASGKIQLLIHPKGVSEEQYTHFREDFDLGDFIGVAGELFRTRMGEVTLKVRELRILAKAINPLPEKWHGLTAVEQRYRQRHVDLIVNEEARRIFVARSRIVTAMRKYLDAQGFLEVETPVLQPLYGGAEANPFITHHNQLHRDLYLRISDELYLKRLIIGDLEKVYEIGHDFRNEGVSRKHNPEFTQMECYEAYADYHKVMETAENMVAFIAQEVFGTMQVEFQGNVIDYTPPWRRITLRDAIKEYAAGIDIEEYTELESLQARAKELGLEMDPKPTWGKQVDELLGTYAEPQLIQPTFVIDYPIEISPLAKKKPGAEHLVERFEIFIGGIETGNAFSELNDPFDQMARFELMGRNKEAGDEEAHPMDEDFIMTMMQGMPPTGGLGIGVDRLTMLMTNQTSIREVILFPQLREQE